MSSQAEIPRFDVVGARRRFPFFETAEAERWVFFDNAGGTFPCRPAFDAFMRFYRENKVQPYGENALAAAAGEQMDRGRRTISELLGAPLETLTLGPSTTQNINTLAWACLGFINAGDEIVVTEQDHEANIGPWERVAKTAGATLRFWPVDAESGELDPTELEALLNERTCLVCVTHSSNIIGTVNPVEHVCELAHAAGARVVVDGVSFAPHSWPDLSRTPADAYAFSTYKTFAPHLGVLYVRPDFLEMLTPQCHFFNTSKPWSRLDAAGPDHAAVAALAGLGEYFADMHAHHFGPSDAPLHHKAAEITHLTHAHETEACALLLDALRELPVRIAGRRNMDGREANVALVPEKTSSPDLCAALAERGVAAKSGHFYAFRLLEKMGVAPQTGVVRISFAHYNTTDDARKAAEALADVLG